MKISTFVLTLLLFFPIYSRAGDKKTGQRYSQIMSEIGRRFEMVGKAAKNNRYELAVFELEEMKAAFEELAGAAPPKKTGDADLNGLREAFINTNPQEMKAAFDRQDSKAAAVAFTNAAATCNGCHKISGRGFIEIPLKLGDHVPVLTPM
jgi:hypothetical protein